MTIASVPSPECEALLCRLLAASPVVVPASQLSDAESEAAIELEEAGYAVVADDPDGEPGIMLSADAASKAGVICSPGGLRWEAAPPILPETAAIVARDEKRKRPRLINATDYAAKVKRKGGKVESPVDPAWGPTDDGGFHRPSNLIGTGTIWDGPDVGNLVRADRVCQVCGVAEIERGIHCLACDRTAGEKPRRPKRRKSA